ncbi:MAG: hypothetical protein Q9163_003503 [Psora crenata]
MNQQPQSSPYYTAGPVQPDQEDQNNKRKGDDNESSAPQRSKRNRYISIAWEFRSMNAHIQSLQQQVNDLYAHLNTLRSSQSPFPMHPSLPPADSPASYRSNMSPSQSRASHPHFQGPTSSAFNLDVAKSSLQTMGIAPPEVQDDLGSGDIDPALDPPMQRQAPVAAMVSAPHKDPLWQLSKDDAIRLCKVYEEEMGMMYPMLDIERIISHADVMFNFIESAARTGLTNRDMARADSLESNDINILKMVLASALMVEEGGESPLGRAIYESCRKAFESKVTGPVDIKGLILLVVVAEYHFQQDEEVQAYRIIGLATRLSLEMGLHRRSSLLKLFADEEERSWAIKLFWSIYVLDRRWSFGTGMPFALQDADIDPALPEPDASTPYLIAMISYSRISSEIWRSSTSTTNFEGTPNEIDREKISYLDYQILQWHNTIPESLRFNPSENFLPPKGVSRGQRRLHIILYLRTNQMRTLIYSPVLQSATTIMENKQLAQVGVNVAKDTVRVLTHLHETTDIYSTQQVCFNYFLLTALGVILLAVAHAPVEFSHQVRDEFYQVLDLVKGFSTNSYISQRLRKAIRGLREIGPKLGVISRPTQLTNTNDPHSSAAVAMAGLAGHQVDEIAAYASAQKSNSIGSSPLNGQQMSHELTNLFEAANIYGTAPNMDGATSNGYAASQMQRAQGVEALSGINGGEFSRIMRDLF